MCKSHFFLKFQVLCEWSSDITSFVESNVCSILKVENVWNLVCWFSFDNSCPNFMSKSYLLLNFWVLFHVQILFAIEFLQRSIDIYIYFWSTLYIVVSTCKVSWFVIVAFTLSLVTQIICVIPRAIFWVPEFWVFCEKRNDIVRAP